MINLTMRDPFTGKYNAMNLDITGEQLDAYYTGKLGVIQNAFPYLTDDEREFIMTGIMPDSWDNMFSSEEEEEV